MAKLPKKPSKPKVSAPLSSWEKYAEAVKNWNKKVADKKNAKSKKQTLIKKFQGNNHFKA